MRQTQPLSVTIPTEIRETLQAISQRHHLPLSQTVSECLREGLLAKGVVLPEHTWSSA